MPHRINSLICAVLSLCLCGQAAFAQSPPPRPATGIARPVAKKPTASPTGDTPRTTPVPRTTREPVGRATTAKEPAESAAPAGTPRPVGPRPAGATQGPAPRQPAVQGPAPQLAFKPITPEMKAVLADWESHTKDITSLYCPITRIEFDTVFGKETRWMGHVYFDNPDKGRIEWKPADDEFMAKLARTNAQGKPFKVIAGAESQWICTGKKIYILDVSNKQYDSILIPPQNQGQNITRSPLPFIFGMKAQDAMQRFAMRFGNQHNPDGQLLDINGKKKAIVLHIVANPLQNQEAREYSEAEIFLDPQTYLPLHLRMLDPGGNKETRYKFDPAKLKVNVNWGLRNPFKDPYLPGWTEMKRGNADPEQPPVRQTQNSEK